MAFFISTGQVFHPFLKHDEFAFLAASFPDAIVTHPTPWEKTLTEGRWLNWAWSFVSRHLTDVHVSFLFFVAWSAFASIAGSLVARGFFGLLAGLAIGLTPEYAELSLWPCALFPSTLILALTVAVFSRLYGSVRDISLFVLLTLSGLCYPLGGPCAPIAGALARNSHGNFRNALRIAFIFVLATACAALIVFALNHHFHGVFGIKPDFLRRELFMDGGFFGNLAATITRWKNYFIESHLIWFVIPAMLANIAILRMRSLFPISIGILVLVCHCITCAGTGVVTPARGNGFVWIWTSALAAYPVLCAGKTGRAACAAILIAIIAHNGMAWTTCIGGFQKQLANLEAFADKLEGPRVILYYSPYGELSNAWCTSGIAEWLWLKRGIVAEIAQARQFRKGVPEYGIAVKRQR